MKYLTKDEVKRLLVCIDNLRDRLLIQLGLVTGCRVSEVVSIKTKNIESDRIKIWDEKKDKYREVVIDPETRAYLNNYIENGWEPRPHRAHQLFYFSSKTANRILKKYCEKAGIPKEKAHWHCLRHTFVVQALDAGIPLNHVCEQTGDSPVTIVSIYGKPSIDNRLAMISTKGKFWEL